MDNCRGIVGVRHGQGSLFSVFVKSWYSDLLVTTMLSSGCLGQ